MRNDFVVFPCYTAHIFQFFFSDSIHQIMSNSAKISSTSEELSKPFDGISTGNIILLLSSEKYGIVPVFLSLSKDTDEYQH